VNITTVRQAVAETLAGVTGLRPYAYDPDTIPAGDADVAVVHIDDEGIDYYEAFRGGTALLYLSVELSVPMSSDRAATERMDSLLSSGAGASRSVIDALQKNRTLGGLTGGFVVRSASKPFVVGDAVGGNSRRLNATLHLTIPIGRL
jgi:hypothetical protein